jgi:hypothetical protein
MAIAAAGFEFVMIDGACFQVPGEHMNSECRSSNCTVSNQLKTEHAIAIFREQRGLHIRCTTQVAHPKPETKTFTNH